MITMRFFTQDELGKVLNINLTAVSELVNCGKIPYTRIHTEDGYSIRFNQDTINKWLMKTPGLKMDDKKFIEQFRKRLLRQYPEAMKEIEEFGQKFFEPLEPKRFYLDQVSNKKMGFVWYVRYLENGRVVPSHWCTHTNDRNAAERFAVENRERLLGQYYERRVNPKSYLEIYTLLKKYYAENSPYLKIDIKRGRTISEKSRSTYHNFITKQFIPYLHKERVKSVEQIDTPLLARFQNHLLAGTRKKPGVKPQTIGHYISYISQIFDHLVMEGYIKMNPCASLSTIKVQSTDCEIRGCYEVDRLKGIFNKRWKDEFSYLLCLVIYTTGMRNSEIERIRKGTGYY